MKILIVKTSSLGDLIQTFPVIHYLKACYPEAQIDWVVEKAFASLVEAHPAIHQVISVSTKKWRQGWWKKETWQEISITRQLLRQTNYDLLFDLQGNIKSGLITAQVKSSKKIGFGLRTVPEWPNLFFTKQRFNPPIGKNIREDYLYLPQQAVGRIIANQIGVQLKITNQEQLKIKEILFQISSQGAGPKIMICSGSNWPNKQLNPSTLASFLQLIAKKWKGQFLLVWGTEQEKEIAHQLADCLGQHARVAEKMQLPTLQNLMASMDLIIAMDSLPLHLAATTNTPTYSVFGASSANKYKPVGAQHEAYQGLCPFGRNFEKRCPVLRTCPTGNCIKNLSAQVLFDHFSQWWKNLKVL